MKIEHLLQLLSNDSLTCLILSLTLLNVVTVSEAGNPFQDPDATELHHPLFFPSEYGDIYAIDYDYSKHFNESYEIHIAVVVEPKFYFYSRNNLYSGIEISDGDTGQAVIKNVPTKFLIHGFLGNGRLDWLLEMKNHYLGKENINVIIVDWGELTPKIKCRICMYPRARYATRKVGPYVATMIQYLNEALHISLENFHCVGFSLGAHVCGYTGKSLRSKYGLKLQRITGLDPAGPMYDCYDTSDRLDKTDAIFVDVIHTCTNILGFSLSIGHIDFYPNGGRNQVGCGFDLFGTCSHSRSYLYFIESIFSTTKLMGRKCSSCEEFTNTNCCSDTKLMTRMGEHVSFDKPGDYYLCTAELAPFGRGDDELGPCTYTSVRGMNPIPTVVIMALPIIGTLSALIYLAYIFIVAHKENNNVTQIEMTISYRDETTRE